MIVELISVGTELLMGNIVNTNAAYLSEKLAALGLSVFYETTVGDNEKRLYETIKTAADRSDIVILTGGLGPTQDDITKEMAAKLCGVSLIEDAHTRKRIEHFFETRGVTNITENNWKQALKPEGAFVIDNHNGSAPGLILDYQEDKKLILMPGPPGELKTMFEGYVFDYLHKLKPSIIYSEMVKIQGLGESFVATKAADLIENLTNPTVAPYAKTGEVHLRVSAQADSEAIAKELVKPIVDDIKNRFGMNVYTTNEHETLEDNIIAMLQSKNMTLATAESCTGGLLAGRIINVPGVSDVFTEGFVTYSNEAKVNRIQVSQASLDQYGAVSAQVAKEMAIGTAAVCNTNVALSITGLAGPDGATPEKPIGLVYVACYINGEVNVKELRFNGTRNKIRENTVVYALGLLRQCILEATNK